MNAKRIAVVKHAFQSLDEQSQKRIAFEKLRKSYRADQHPRVKTREKKAETVLADFIACMGAKCQGLFVTEAGFLDYYADINATLPAEKDDYFVELILRTWGLSADAAASFITPQRIAEIEGIIFEKIRQKTHGADDEGKTIQRIFRHFDLDGYGTLEFNEFKKALETLGCLFSTAEMQGIFKKYDSNGNGKLDYEEFSMFFAHKGSGNNPNVNPVFGISREPPNQVVEKIKKTLKQRGANGIRGLGIVFRQMDNSRSGKLDRYEFMWGLKENGHNLSPSEFERVFKYFDKNNDGKISYDEFLVVLRGHLNERRKALVNMAFQKLDKDRSGVVDINDLINTYSVEQHPQFKSGEKSKKEIIEDFMKQWDTVTKDGQITQKEFQIYYQDLSASIDDDDYFELTIRNAWHLAGGQGQYENTSIQRELVTNPDGSQKVVMAKEGQYQQNASKFWGAQV